MIVFMSASPLLVAVVDDEESVRKALRRLCRSAGMEVDTFSSGHEFLTSLTARQPDCLVLDYHMPGLTGLDVQQQLMARGYDVPAIIITAHDQPGLDAKLLGAGVAAYFAKPVNDRELLEAIAKAVSRSNLKQPFSNNDSSSAS
jgi:FixJ family two-component response regulator